MLGKSANINSWLRRRLRLELEQPSGVQLVDLAAVVGGDVDLVQHLDDLADEERAAFGIERAIGAEQHVVAAEELDAADRAGLASR